MDLKKFIDESLVQQVKLARAMYPNVANAPAMLNQKIKEAKTGNGKQRINENDKEKLKNVLTDHIKSCQTFIDSID